MLHPDIVVKKSPISGKGLFAKRNIPKGTILLISPKVRVYSMSQYNAFSKKYRAILRKYSCEDDEGNLVYHIDNVKYWNHGCNPNASYIGDFEIAIRNIKTGEELTYDYGLIHPRWLPAMKCRCGTAGCRKLIKREAQNSPVVRKLHLLAKAAIKKAFRVKQPLISDKAFIRAIKELQ